MLAKNGEIPRSGYTLFAIYHILNISIIESYMYYVLCLFLGVWGLVNNAGIMPNYCPAEWTKLSEYKKVSDVNLFGSINMTLTFLPLIRRSKGRIINVCSAVCNVGMTATTNYCVSKAGLRMFTTCLRYLL